MIFSIKIFRILIIISLLLFCTTLYSQYKISGNITNATTSKSINDVEIYLNKSGDLWQGEKGDYVISNLASGVYDLVFFSPEHKVYRTQITIISSNEIANIRLEELGEILSEVIINVTKKSVFGLHKLKDVQGVAIYAGKKSEVILLGNTIANLATNNARQIYSKVAGLNIWESDGGGLQLGIGGRGLNPNRTSNFNVRQNGYDISADALGYPESYYTPPSEALEKIEIVRGAASLQYGTQFGGLLNFILKQPVRNKEFSLTTRQTTGSFGLLNSFNNISGTIDKFSYNSYINYKKSDGYRHNSDFYQWNMFAGLYYQINNKSKIGFEFTRMNYLAHQSGGLSDKMFASNPKQSNRTRNWFNVNWNLAALHFDYKFSEQTKMNARAYTLYANRKALGYRNPRPETEDPLTERELIIGNFKTFGAEIRFLYNYNLFQNKSTLLLGSRYYRGDNTSKQGLGNDGNSADFKFISIDDYITKSFTDEVNINSSNYKYPNTNIAVFGENIFKISEELSITPGFRFEHINTKANGNYRVIRSNQSGDITLDTTKNEDKNLSRDFMLFGIGTSYKPSYFLELYANISQNYRSVTFSDIRVSSPSSMVDPNIKDEKGFSIDIGVRGKFDNLIKYDITGFYLNYDNRLGDILAPDPNNGILKRIRTNVGKATIFGLESLIQWNVLPTFQVNNRVHKLNAFVNTALIKSEYTKQYYANSLKQIKGKEVEFVPAINFKTGLQYSYKNFGASFQYSYLSKQFTDATNSLAKGGTGTVGEIPSYNVMDFSLAYKFLENWKMETGINNLLDAFYFTRRATGYPGPGIIPSDGRSFYLTVQFKFGN